MKDLISNIALHLACLCLLFAETAAGNNGPDSTPLIYPHSTYYESKATNSYGDVHFFSTNNFEDIAKFYIKAVSDDGWKRIGDLPFTEKLKWRYAWGGVFRKNQTVVKISCSGAVPHKDFEGNDVIPVYIIDFMFLSGNAPSVFPEQCLSKCMAVSAQDKRIALRENGFRRGMMGPFVLKKYGWGYFEAKSSQLDETLRRFELNYNSGKMFKAIGLDNLVPGEVEHLLPAHPAAPGR